jgi:hypothetical protein
MTYKMPPKSAEACLDIAFNALSDAIGALGEIEHAQKMGQLDPNANVHVTRLMSVNELLHTAQTLVVSAIIDGYIPNNDDIPF